MTTFPIGNSILQRKCASEANIWETKTLNSSIVRLPTLSLLFESNLDSIIEKKFNAQLCLVSVWLFRFYDCISPKHSTYLTFSSWDVAMLSSIEVSLSLHQFRLLQHPTDSIKYHLSHPTFPLNIHWDILKISSEIIDMKICRKKWK